jgi:uncharacterized protein (TIGR02099 family)
MLNSLPVRLLWHSLNWLTRITIIASAVFALLCAITILTLRYWLLPEIEQFHDRITAQVSVAMGNPVSVDQIQGDWIGLHPHLSLTNVRILDKQGNQALLLPRINASVSWLSLLAAELRLSSLEIDRPELLIHRDTQGHLFVGSLAVTTESNNNDLSEWLLHQSSIVVRDARIVWQDDQRGAPPLALNQVNLRIENLFSHHQFALRAVPPAALSSPLDIRGDFHGRYFNRPEQWRGLLFAQLDRTDLLAWRPWLTLPSQLSRGRGALRVWLGLEKGKITQFTTDMSLHDVATRLAENAPEMDVQYLHGRAAWKTTDDGWEVTTRALSMRLHNGLSLLPTDFYFRTRPVTLAHPGGGALRANLLQLESLVSLANFFPLDAPLRAQLNAYAPRGRVSNLDMQWQGTPEKLLDYTIKGQFENLSLQQVGKLPGFTGLSATLDGNQTSGRLNINTHNLSIDAPGVLRETLLFNTLTGQASWQHEQGELMIRADNVAVANEDLAGNLFGNYRTQAGTKGVMDLTVNLTRGNIRRAARYTPLVAVSKKDNDWLNDALLSGHTEDFHLRLKGNLSDFPLDGTKDTLFEITAHGQDAAMLYAPDWPKIENLSGEFRIHNNRMEVHSPAATILGARIHNLSIVQPDMSHIDTPLEIKGEADAANNIFLQFIQQSPVRTYIKGFTDGISASGDGHLNMNAQIPLLQNKPAHISGLLHVQNSDIDLGPGVPWLRATRGELAFTESGMQTNNVTSVILGGPARLNVQTAEGGVIHAGLQGRISLDTLRKTESSPLLERLHGAATWDASIKIVNKVANLTLNSSLQGISSSLPAPLAKSANEIWPLHIEKKNIADHQDMITAQLGRLLSARLYSSEENGVNTIKRGIVNFGGSVSSPDSSLTGKTGPSTLRPDSGQTGPSTELITSDLAGVVGQPSRLASSSIRTGIWLTGNLPSLSLQGWNGLTAGSGASLPINGANLHIDKLSGYGMNLADLQINAARRGDGLSAQLSSNALNGEIIWQPQGYNGTDKITARLKNLYWTNENTAVLPAAKPTPVITQPQQLPAVDITIDDLLLKDKNIGRFELVGFPEGQNWRLRRLHITNPDGNLTGDGLWRSKQTQVNLLLDISNAGKILARSGYPNTVRNGNGKLVANLNWDGQPDEFNYATLNGTLKLDTGKGQFLKMDPGIGKLLGILSLQALPKRITLDFNDVFSAGFEFDNINGNATIAHGVMQTQDLHIDGSSAKVTMQGTVNLNDETQNMHIVVLPTLGSSVSMLSAFAAGPVVGLGALIVNKVLGNPLDYLMSFEYNVDGTWSNPNVVKVGQKPVKLQEVPKAADTPKK